MNPSVLLVDWLGRGGIAQTTESWGLELAARGYDVEVVTRPGRELGVGVRVTEARAARGRFRAHAAVVASASERIRMRRPEWVVIQNYVVPALERPVFRAARTTGARVAVVVHNDQPHSRATGTSVGLRRNLDLADVVLAHTEFVADRVSRVTRRDVRVVPHPLPLGLLACDRHVPDWMAEQAAARSRWCAHFGTVSRRYKGTEIVPRLAAGQDGEWRFVVAGAGAGSYTGDNVVALDGYVEPGVLTGMVSASDVTLAPYRHATQSGVVVLAHALGSVPIATAVGGIPEQVTHGVDGILVPPGSDVTVWADALERLADDEQRKDLARAGELRAAADHDIFVGRVVELLR
jgi:glycosyltransferase involved in cell wall biosynthesis